MLLSEPVCECVGKNNLETGPVWKVQPLSDGGLGVIVSKDPFRYSREDKERFKAHLGMNG